MHSCNLTRCLEIEEEEFVEHVTTSSDSLTFERQYRTPFSEGYHLVVEGKRVGHVDLHYTQRDVHASLILELEMSEGAVLDLIERVDDALVLSAEVSRDDLLVTVYRGKEIGFYSDDFLAERASRQEPSPR